MGCGGCPGLGMRRSGIVGSPRDSRQIRGPGGAGSTLVCGEQYRPGTSGRDGADDRELRWRAPRSCFWRVAAPRQHGSECPHCDYPTCWDGTSVARSVVNWAIASVATNTSNAQWHWPHRASSETVRIVESSHSRITSSGGQITSQGISIYCTQVNTLASGSSQLPPGSSGVPPQTSLSSVVMPSNVRLP